MSRPRGSRKKNNAQPDPLFSGFNGIAGVTISQAGTVHISGHQQPQNSMSSFPPVQHVPAVQHQPIGNFQPAGFSSAQMPDFEIDPMGSSLGMIESNLFPLTSEPDFTSSLNDLAFSSGNSMTQLGIGGNDLSQEPIFRAQPGLRTDTTPFQQLSPRSPHTADTEYTNDIPSPRSTMEPLTPNSFTFSTPMITVVEVSTQAVKQRVTEIDERKSFYENNVVQLRSAVQALTEPFQQEPFTEVVRYGNMLAEEITQWLGHLKALVEGELLSYGDFQCLLETKQKLETALVETNLYRQELEEISTNKHSFLAKLVITEQPFPCPIHINKQMPAITVKLKYGARCQIQTKQPVVAYLIKNFTQKRKIKLENQQEYLQDGVARFLTMKILSGTLMRIVALKFTISVDMQRGQQRMTKTIESEQTKPTIALTREKLQYTESMGKLLEKELFSSAEGPQLEIPVILFCNYIQRVFCIATEQSCEGAMCLSRSTLQRIVEVKFRKRLDNQTKISMNEFQDFWKWFGPFLLKFRRMKDMTAMFLTGLIWPFISKDEATNVLNKYRAGCFLVRLSLSKPGGIVISYHLGKDDRPVRHYLLKDSDIYEGMTVPVYLRNLHTFQKIIRTWEEQSGRQCAPLNKLVALDVWIRDVPQADLDSYDGIIYHLPNQVLGMSLN